MCGIYFLFDTNKTFLSNILKNLRSIQHRGHDSYGLIGRNIGNSLMSLRLYQKGKIEIDEKDIETNRYHMFLCHLRYKTSGLNLENGSQPISSRNKFGLFNFVFNGNIPCNEYSSEYTLDTTMIKEFFERDDDVDCWEDLLIRFVNRFQRAYSIILVTESNKLFLLKDRYGVRPLNYSYCFSAQTLEISSESVGISLEQPDIREVNSGEILEFNLENIDKPREIYNFNKDKRITPNFGGKCIFEYIYFLNPQTTWNNLKVSEIRNKWAESLAYFDSEWINEDSTKDFIVIGIPSTGIEPGKAYAEKLNLSYRQAITKNPSINRTFILPNEERDKVSKKKYIYDKTILSGKEVIIIDDSIVRGITMRNLVHSIYKHGAKGVHIRIISPTITDICKYGIDIPTHEELIATNKTIPEMTEHFGASSLKFLDIESLLETIDPYINKETICSGCFGGTYNDVDIEDLVTKPTPKQIANQYLSTLSKEIPCRIS
jgi:amidophosphoribosyltransferase